MRNLVPSAIAMLLLIVMVPEAHGDVPAHRQDVASAAVGLVRHRLDAPDGRSAYWTSSRMREAEPRAMILPGRLPRRAVRLRPDGPAQIVPAAGPATPEPAPRRRRPPFDNTAYRYPYPFERFQAPGLTDYTAYPYSAVGKVFLSDALGDYVCSGAVINSDAGNVVLTAGHCATLYGIDIDSAVFVPAYRGGTAPLGEWPVESFLVPKRWERVNDEAYDVAFYLLGSDPMTGEQVEAVTGGLGIAWNMSSIRHWHILGYPAAKPFDGEVQWTCTASQASLDTVGYRSIDPPAIGLGCDMTGGSSGGPWISGFGDTNIVNGLVAYGYRRYPKALFGPYFGDAVGDLFACANEGSC
ncbi:MAG TPA: hypothetical protein VIE12_05225 [Actinomycetota bacterium]